MPSPAPPPTLILASSSPARKELLQRLRLPFQHASPDINERPLPGETIADMVIRLSRAKAHAVARLYPGALIVGSDQALILEGSILGKPGSHMKAREQLLQMAGREVTFHTGLCLLNTRNGRSQTTVEPYTVRFRQLPQAAIENYLLAEQPYSCAGSFKAEGLGIALFESFSGRDPNSLIGLPLMALVDFLLNEGVQIP
jgi:MAF protein